MAGRPKRADDLGRLEGSAELRELVWDRLEGGITYSRICMETGLGKAALLEWLDSEANAERHALARARCAAALADEALDIADEAGDAKLRIGQRNWLAERFNRARYGQKVEHQVSGQVTHLHLAALQQRRQQAPAQAIGVSEPDVLDVEAKTLEQQLAEL